MVTQRGADRLDDWTTMLSYALSVSIQFVRSKGINTPPNDGLGCIEVQR